MLNNCAYEELFLLYTVFSYAFKYMLHVVCDCLFSA